MTRARLLAHQTFRSLRVRNYRLFFAGQLVSVSGTWMQTVAQSWLVLTTLHGGPVQLGVTVALQFLPMLLFGLWGGVIADRFDKRTVLVWTQASAGALAIVLWLLVLTNVVALWMVYLLAFFLGCVTVVDNPTRQAFVTEMVGQGDIANAVGLNSAVFNAARLIGPAIAGVLISTVGVALSFLLNGISYLAVIAGLLAMRPDELFALPRVPRERGQIRAGLRYVWATAELRSTLLLVTVIATLGFNFLVIIPLFAKDVFHGGASLLGVLTSVMAAGSLVGALGAAGKARPTRPLLVGSGLAFGVVTLLAAAAPTPTLEGVALLPLGAASIVFIATANSTLQLASEPAMRGRVMALYALIFLGSTPVGGPLMGWIAQHWGARSALGVGGAASLLAALVALVAVVRRGRERAAVGERERDAAPALA
jgi:MFS family permease